MDISKSNRDDTLVDFIFWPLTAWEDYPGLRVQVERCSIWKMSLGLRLTEDRGVGLSFSLLGLYFYFELMNVIPKRARSAMWAWAQRRANVLSERASKGKTWESQICPPGSDEWKTETRWAKEVYAHDLDPSEREVLYVCLRLRDPDEGPSLHWYIWSNGDCADNDRWPWDGRGWGGYVNFMDTIFGHSDLIEEVEHERMEMTLLMPEGGYPVTVRTFSAVHKRPRMPFKKTYHRASVKCERGVPIPGKGTQPYNCDDDAIYSTTFAGRDSRWYAEEALLEFREDVLLRRIRYGGVDWLAVKGRVSEVEE